MISTNQLSAEERTVVLRFCASVATRIVWRSGYFSDEQFEPEVEQFKNSLSSQISLICYETPDASGIIRSTEVTSDFKPTEGQRIYTRQTCDFSPTERQRNFILNKGRFEDYYGNFGGIYFGKLMYLDSEMWCGDRKISESESHEYYFAVDLIDGLKDKFIDFEGESERNRRILKTLERSWAPELEGLTAAVEFKDNVLTVLTDDLQVRFTANKDNFDVQFNTEDLGGELKLITENGRSRGAYVGQKPMDFISGATYFIRSSRYGCEMQGGANINMDGFYSEFFIDLKSQDDRYCDITIQSDKIFLDRKSLKR